MSETVTHEAGALVRNLTLISPFQIKALIVALVATVGGWGGVAYNWFNPPNEPQSVQIVDQNGRPFVSAEKATGLEPSEKPTDPWSKWISEHGARIGMSFIGGFAIGFIFRAFIKTMTILTLIVVGGLGALSYFHVINIDFSRAEQAWNSNSEWITAQATKLKDVVWAYLPSSTTGSVGAFLGLKRK